MKITDINPVQPINGGARARPTLIPNFFGQHFCCQPYHIEVLFSQTDNFWLKRHTEFEQKRSIAGNFRRKIAFAFFPSQLCFLPSRPPTLGPDHPPTLPLQRVRPKSRKNSNRIRNSSINRLYPLHQKVIVLLILKITGCRNLCRLGGGIRRLEPARLGAVAQSIPAGMRPSRARQDGRRLGYGHVKGAPFALAKCSPPLAASATGRRGSPPGFRFRLQSPRRFP